MRRLARLRTKRPRGVTTISLPSSKYPSRVVIARSSSPSGTSRIEDLGRDQLFEVAVVPPRELQLLGAPEVQLNVVLDREPDASEHLLGHGRDIAERLTGEQLGHRREARVRA